jgi:hypothetical protein
MTRHEKGETKKSSKKTNKRKDKITLATEDNRRQHNTRLDKTEDARHKTTQHNTTQHNATQHKTKQDTRQPQDHYKDNYKTIPKTQKQHKHNAMPCNTNSRQKQGKEARQGKGNTTQDTLCGARVVRFHAMFQ